MLPMQACLFRPSDIVSPTTAMGALPVWRYLRDPRSSASMQHILLAGAGAWARSPLSGKHHCTRLNTASGTQHLAETSKAGSAVENSELQDLAGSHRSGVATRFES